MTGPVQLGNASLTASNAMLLQLPQLTLAPILLCVFIASIAAALTTIYAAGCWRDLIAAYLT
jgi:hypothetical protein